MDRTPIFESIREILGRGLAPGEVRRLDRAIDKVLESRAIDMQIGLAGIALIKRFESCALRRSDGMIAAYPDPGTGGAPWTIGWGATGPGIGPATVWSQAQCDRRLGEDIERHASEVRRAIGGAPTTQHQFDALVSFHYNTGAIGRATLTRLHIAGDFAGAAAEFGRWNRAGGRAMAGLTRRRLAEAALYSASNGKDTAV